MKVGVVCDVVMFNGLRWVDMLMLSSNLGLFLSFSFFVLLRLLRPVCYICFIVLRQFAGGRGRVNSACSQSAIGYSVRQITERSTVRACVGAFYLSSRIVRYYKTRLFGALFGVWKNRHRGDSNPLRAEPNGFRVRLLSRADTVS